MHLNLMSEKINTGFFFEKDRIESFKSWPFNNKALCNIKKMSAAGFYWSGNEKENDTATCFMCSKVLDGWEESDNPWLEHQKHAPQCLFVKLGRPECELNVEEFIGLLESYIKTRSLKRLDGLKNAFKLECEQLRKTINKML